MAVVTHLHVLTVTAVASYYITKDKTFFCGGLHLHVLTVTAVATHYLAYPV